ncbi:hypothetical protein sos41_03310 [Alphaproteobacteria bacterium SO-S41]|nr:hypothetical protein sos41_03310 [Alphaproteobacteria bacterium SO-S41]
MKHAGDSALDALEPLLARIRDLVPDLAERKRGVFYRKAEAALHFHEDPDGLFADWRAAKGDKDFLRFRVSSKSEQTAFLKALKP